MSHILGKSRLAPADQESGQEPLSVVAVRYAPERAAEWDSFVARSRNGTLFHERAFLAYHAEGRFTDDSLLLYRGGRLRAVYPAALEEIDGEWWSVSHPGSTYGGPVLSPDASLADVVGVIRAILEHASTIGTAGVRMRLTEQALRQLPSDEVEYVLWALGFQPAAEELSTTISLAAGAEAARGRYRPATARNVRSALHQGVTTGWSDDFGAFWRLLEKNLQRHGARPTHSVSELERLRALCGADRIRLAVARIDQDVAAGVLVFEANPAAFHAFYIAQDYTLQRSRALSAVIDFLVCWGASVNYRWFNLGVSTEGAGRIVNWGLFRFKEGFGGSGFTRTTYVRRVSLGDRAG